jgi:hypothetical protein
MDRHSPTTEAVTALRGDSVPDFDGLRIAHYWQAPDRRSTHPHAPGPSPAARASGDAAGPLAPIGA